MDHPKNKLAARSFATAFAGALSASVAEITGFPWPLEVTDDHEPAARDTQPLQFRIKVEGGLVGNCFVEVYEPQLPEFLAKLGGQNPGDEAGDPTITLAPMLSAAVTRLKSSLSPQYGELSFKVDSVSGLACGGMFVVPLRDPADRLSSPSVFLYFDGDLLNALSSAVEGQKTADAPSRPILPANLRLVMDVELNVSLRFGQRQLPLREVLELSSGSVIELDRMVDDPVEMLLDGKVVARGEAVIVDGNYGLRVTEIPQAMETHLFGS